MRPTGGKECSPEAIMGVEVGLGGGVKTIKLQLYVSGNVLKEPLFCKYCNIAHMYYSKENHGREGQSRAKCHRRNTPGSRNQLGKPYLVKAKAGCLEN